MSILPHKLQKQLTIPLKFGSYYRLFKPEKKKPFNDLFVSCFLHHRKD